MLGKKDRTVGLVEIRCAGGTVKRAIAACNAELRVDFDRAELVQGACPGRTVREARLVAAFAESTIDCCEITGDVGCDLGVLFDGACCERKARPWFTHDKIGS